MRSLIAIVPAVESVRDAVPDLPGDLMLRDQQSSFGNELANLSGLSPRALRELKRDSRTGFLFVKDASEWLASQAVIQELLNQARNNVLLLREPLPKAYDS